ncbi:keratin-associated protein 13-1-like [Bubalus kerabau]|uniref:keratin-associated protein 13-1-like n=1 Tax=Bubalus carabanensis TaxID=3119969 RepID=UPI00244E7B59|nr:keratin-associated protein 13-1-like [Bubalus carabanensis]
MSYNCCSGNFSSLSLQDHLRYSGSSYGSSFPSNLVYRTDLCSPGSCHLGSSLYSHETCCEPIRTQTVVSSPCQTSCYHLRTSTFSSPCQTTCSGSLGFRSSSCSSLSSGSRSCYSVGCGSRGFRHLGYGICGFPSLSSGSGFCRPTFFASRSCHSSCYRPTCGSGF